MNHDEWLQVVSILTFIASIISMLSGLVPVYSAVRSKNVQNYPFFFFLAYTLLTLISLYYGYLLEDALILVINTVALLLSAVFLSVYVWFCIHKIQAMMQILSMLFICAFMHFGIGYYSNDVTMLQSYVGLISCTVATIQNTIPFVEVREAFRQRSAAPVVLSLLIATTNSALLWLIYGLLLDNIFVSFPNVPALLVNAARFYVYFRFSSHSYKKITPENTDQSEVEL